MIDVLRLSYKLIVTEILWFTCKNEEGLRHQSANKIICRIFRHSMTANAAVSDGIQLKFEIIQAFMVILATCKNKKDPK